MNKGKVVQIIGPVVDIQFKEILPDIHHALKIILPNKKELTLEVQQHLGEQLVRSLALGPTDGLVRGTEVIDSGGPITIPVGTKALGRMFNVIGEPIDGKGPLKIKNLSPIHKSPPLHYAARDQSQNAGNRYQGH